jgi:hypothetical protein
MSNTLLSSRRFRTSQAGPFSARSLLFCGIAASSMGERKSGALVKVLANVWFARKLSPWEYLLRAFT